MIARADLPPTRRAPLSVSGLDRARQTAGQGNRGRRHGLVGDDARIHLPRCQRPGPGDQHRVRGPATSVAAGFGVPMAAGRMVRRIESACGPVARGIHADLMQIGAKPADATRARIAAGPRMFWCRIEESNPRPSHYECAALPTELIRRRARNIQQSSARFNRGREFVSCPESPGGGHDPTSSAGRPRFLR